MLNIGPIRIKPAVIAALALFCGGCGPEAPPPSATPAIPAGVLPVDKAQPSEARPLATAGERKAKLVDREIWDIYYIGGNRIGYGSTRWTLAPDNPDLLEGQGKMRLVIKRFGEENVSEVEMSQVETLEGDVRSFDSDSRLAQAPAVTRGERVGDTMSITVYTGETARRMQMDWPPGTGGYFAIDEDLLCHPMQPGERRVLRSLMPVFNQVAEVEFKAVDYESTELPSGPQELLRIETTTRMQGAEPIKGLLWTTRDGEAMKSVTTALDQIVYRATKEEALGAGDTAQLDLGDRSLVRLEKPMADAHRSREVRYRVVLADGEPAKTFLNDISQQVKALDDHSAEILVRAVRPDSPPAGQAKSEKDTKPTDDDRRPNSFVQSDNERIVNMAKGAAGNETDPWRQAVILERLVHDKVAAKNYSQTFATAADVAQSLEGDCTEHAVLLAALLRAQGIPARVAIGLVYVPISQAFAFHMWTEAYIGDRWIGLDGTIGAGGIAACYLKLATSDLKDATGMASFLPIAQVLGRLKVEVLEEE